jgi:transposase
MERIHGEILTGKERRRRWSSEEKQRVVAETLQPGVSVSSVARRHGLHPNQVFIWRTQVRAGELGVPGSALFVPVTVSTDAARPQATSVTAAASAADRRSTIEVVLRNGRLLRVSDSMTPEVLARLAAALEQQ